FREEDNRLAGPSRRGARFRSSGATCLRARRLRGPSNRQGAGFSAGLRGNQEGREAFARRQATPQTAKGHARGRPATAPQPPIVTSYQFHPPKSWTLAPGLLSLGAEARASDCGFRVLMRGDGKASDVEMKDQGSGILLTADEVAQILRVPKSWVYSHLSELPVIRLGRYVRFRRSEIDGYLEQRGACQ